MAADDDDDGGGGGDSPYLVRFQRRSSLPGACSCGSTCRRRRLQPISWEIKLQRCISLRFKIMFPKTSDQIKDVGHGSNVSTGTYRN
jgi:hypothetical protein